MQPAVTAPGGVRSALTEKHRPNAHRSPPSARLVDRLDAGEPVVLQRWQVPQPWQRDLPAGDQFAWWRVECDGDLTAVRPLVFVGEHRLVDGGRRVGRHFVDHVPVVVDGDESEIRIDLDEVRARVADPQVWSL